MDDEQVDRDDLQRAAGGVVAEKHEPVINTWFWAGQGKGALARDLRAPTQAQSRELDNTYAKQPKNVVAVEFMDSGTMCGFSSRGLSITWRARPEDSRCLRAAWVKLTHRELS